MNSLILTSEHKDNKDFILFLLVLKSGMRSAMLTGHYFARKEEVSAVTGGCFLLFFSFLLCVKDVWLPSQRSLQCAFVFQIRKTKQAVSQYSCRAVCCIKLWAMYATERALADASRGDVWLGYKNSRATWSVCKQLCLSSGSVETPGASPNLTANSEEKYNNVFISFVRSSIAYSPLPRGW